MYQRILVPIDGSETAALGLKEAVRLAKSQAARIRLVLIVNELIVTIPEGYVDYGRMVKSLRSSGKTILAHGEATVRNAGVEVDSTLVEAMGGQAGEHIIQHAKEWAAELIVCGTHGRRGIRRIVLGSDAEYIVRHTPVPILLVRSGAPIAT